jgi:methionine-R-sulfoxide reductase
MKGTKRLGQGMLLCSLVSVLMGINACGSRGNTAMNNTAGGSAMTDTSNSKQSRKVCDPNLKSELTTMQYQVACEGGTEPPFRNEYWNNKEPGVYVDIVSGVPLFLSTQKFDSGTGWPSFTEPVTKDAVEEISDSSHGMVRTEVRASGSGSHLGHVFPDGPAPSGLRYCINSASLKFVPVSELDVAGLGYLKERF